MIEAIIMEPTRLCAGKNFRTRFRAAPNIEHPILGRFPTTGLYAGLYEFFELITQFNPLSTVPTTGRSTPLG